MPLSQNTPPPRPGADEAQALMDDLAARHVADVQAASRRQVPLRRTHQPAPQPTGDEWAQDSPAQVEALLDKLAAMQAKQPTRAAAPAGARGRNRPVWLRAIAAAGAGAVVGLIVAWLMTG